MTKTKTIKVTADHIARGIKKDCSRCPVALSLMDCLGAGSVTVWHSQIHLSCANGYPLTFKTPRSVKRFMKAFDAMKLVGPFNFKIARTL